METIQVELISLNDITQLTLSDPRTTWMKVTDQRRPHFGKLYLQLASLMKL